VFSCLSVLDILDLPRRPPEVSHPCHGRCERLLVSTVSLLFLVLLCVCMRIESHVKTITPTYDGVDLLNRYKKGLEFKLYLLSLYFFFV
jgi:hypothetical protein